MGFTLALGSAAFEQEVAPFGDARGLELPERDRAEVRDAVKIPKLLIAFERLVRPAEDLAIDSAASAPLKGRDGIQGDRRRKPPKGKRMKSLFSKASFALATTLLFAVAPARATTSITLDGVWWQGLSDREKIVAVQGVLSGIGAGHSVGHTDGWKDAITVFKVSDSQINQILNQMSAGKPLPYTKAPDFSQTFGIYVDEINLWYKIHPTRTFVEPGTLLGLCFGDKPVFEASVCDKFGSDQDK